MKTRQRFILGGLLTAMALSGCGSKSANTNDITFSGSDLIQSSYGGLGVEWGVYEDTDKLDESSWERIYANIKRLAPVRIRCMINYDWFVENFDSKGDSDKTNDTWDYNFANKWGDNLNLLLKYCQANNIQVAFGSWNVVGTLSDDVWNMYGSGTLTYKDVEIVSRSEVTAINTGSRTIGSDGVIDNFDSYTSAAEPFYQWKLSTSNKDEFITLNSLKALGSNNKYCAQMAYKADMAAATYSLGLTVETTGVDSLSLWLKDASVKSDNSVFNYLDSVSAHAYIGLTLTAGTIYYFEIAALSKVWTNYVIPFSAFKVSSGSEQLTASNIAKLSLAFSYVYYLEDGVTQYPTYMMSNPVYVDNIVLLNSGLTVEAEYAKEKAIKADASDATKATIEDAESYATTADVLNSWTYGNTNENNNLELANDVSSEGGQHSLKMNYKSYSSVSYAIPTTVDASIGTTMRPKGIVVDLKGDGKATVYINFYLLVNGTVMLVRKTIESSELKSGWARYAIGFGEFTDYVSPSTASVTVNNIIYVYQISFGIVNSDYSASAIYMDNLRLDNSITRTTDTATVIA